MKPIHFLCLFVFSALSLVAASCQPPVTTSSSAATFHQDIQPNFDLASGTITQITTEDGDGKTLNLLLPESDSRRARMGKVFVAWRTSGGTWADFNLSPAMADIASQADANGARFEVQPKAAPFRIVSDFHRTEENCLAWTLEFMNTANGSLEIGSLAFPLPLNNNYYQTEAGFSQSDEGMRKLFESCFYVQRYLGGATGYVLARRLNGMVPDFLFYAGEGTPLEFTHMLQTGWEGVPLLYPYSKALRDRAMLQSDWMNGHASLTLQPQGSKKLVFYLRRFDREVHATSTEDVVYAQVDGALFDAGKVALDIFPGMTVPQDLPAYVVIKTRAQVQNVQVKPEAAVRQLSQRLPILRVDFKQPGEHDLQVIASDGTVTHARFLVTKPAETALKDRADFIAAKQHYRKQGSVLDGAILVYDNARDQMLVDAGSSWGSGGYEGGLTDAQFLAWKNSLLPDRAQVDLLENYTNEFLLDELQNPGTFQVTWVVSEQGPHRLGRPYNSAHAINFHYGMYLIGKRYGMLTKHQPKDYLQFAAETALDMFETGWKWHLNHVGFMGLNVLYDLITTLHAEGMEPEAQKLEAFATARGKRLLAREYPYSAEPLYDTTGYEDVYFTSKYLGDEEHMERTVRCALANKAFGPAWFWCGTDKRYWDAMENNPQDGYYGTDKGENCFHYTATLTALVGLDFAERGRYVPDQMGFRKAYAALLGELGMIGTDGKGHMCYTPDPFSHHAGFNEFSGDVGLGLYGYLRGARAVVRKVMPQPMTVEMGFGCEITESDDKHLSVRIADGAGRKFLVPEQSIEITVDTAMLKTVSYTRDQRTCTITLKNPAPVSVEAHLSVYGLWASTFNATGAKVSVAAYKDRQLVVPVELASGEEKVVTLKAVTK